MIQKAKRNFEIGLCWKKILKCYQTLLDRQRLISNYFVSIRLLPNKYKEGLFEAIYWQIKKHMAPFYGWGFQLPQG